MLTQAKCWTRQLASQVFHLNKNRHKKIRDCDHDTCKSSHITHVNQDETIHLACHHRAVLFFATKPNLCVTESRQGTGCDGSMEQKQTQEERVYLWWSHILRGYVFVVMHTRMLFHAWLQTGRGVMDYGQIYQHSCFTRIITIILLFSPTVSSFKEGAIEPLPVNRWETFRIKETGCHLSTYLVRVL